MDFVLAGTQTDRVMETFGGGRDRLITVHLCTDECGQLETGLTEKEVGKEKMKKKKKERSLEKGQKTARAVFSNTCLDPNVSRRKRLIKKARKLRQKSEKKRGTNQLRRGGLERSNIYRGRGDGGRGTSLRGDQA